MINSVVQISEIKLLDYTNTFVQRKPRYGIKYPHIPWTSKNYALSNRPITAHLDGDYSVGVLAKWYPGFCIIDIDSRTMEEVEDVRSAIGMNPKNSMLYKTESPDSYHILFRPELKNKPPTACGLQRILGNIGKVNGVEIYPQPNKIVRLPFNPFQKMIDEEYRHIETWEEKFYWFCKLDPVDLESIKHTQSELPLFTKRKKVIPYTMIDAECLLESGLQGPSSREQSQFIILLSFFRQNMIQEYAEKLTYNWIIKKHNGFSKDIFNPRSVRDHISRQASRIWGDYYMSQTFPDSTHNGHNGFISKQDIEETVGICRASKPMMKFLFQLVKYYYPRRFRDSVRIHSNLLKNWKEFNGDPTRQTGARTYLIYISKLENMGILKRCSKYSPGGYSKEIKLNWTWKNSANAVLYDGRSLDGFDETIKLVFNPTDFRALLRASGATRQYAFLMVKRIYEA